MRSSYFKFCSILSVILWITPSLAGILTQGRLLPVTKDAKTIGYRVTKIQNLSLWQNIHLKNDDILTEINGNPLDSAEKVTDLFRLIGDKKLESLTILRSGKRVILRFSKDDVIDVPGADKF